MIVNIGKTACIFIFFQGNFNNMHILFFREILTRQLTGVRPTIHIGELIFASGDAMKDVITFAFDLPKDNKVKDKESFSCTKDLKLK